MGRPARAGIQKARATAGGEGGLELAGEARVKTVEAS